jgi:hypothetical protein
MTPLTVNTGVPRPVVTTTKQFIVFKSRENIDIQCEASDVWKTSTTVTWYHAKSKPLTRHKEEFLPNDTLTSILSVQNASEEDVGYYSCHVKVFDLTTQANTLLILTKKGE